VSQDEAAVPSRIIDQQAWIEGFLAGWEDARRYPLAVPSPL